MQLDLIIPGLSWLASYPGQHPSHPLHLPALDALLGLSRGHWAPPRHTDALLADALGLRNDVSHALLRRSGEASPPSPDGHWLCCDPVHLHFARDTLLLADASGLAITRQLLQLLGRDPAAAVVRVACGRRRRRCRPAADPVRPDRQNPRYRRLLEHELAGQDAPGIAAPPRQRALVGVEPVDEGGYEGRLRPVPSARHHAGIVARAEGQRSTVDQ